MDKSRLNNISIALDDLNENNRQLGTINDVTYFQQRELIDRLSVAIHQYNDEEKEVGLIFFYNWLNDILNDKFNGNRTLNKHEIHQMLTKLSDIFSFKLGSVKDTTHDHNFQYWLANDEQDMSSFEKYQICVDKIVGLYSEEAGLCHKYCQ